MSEQFVDTDVLIRLLTGDDPVKQAAAVRLFEQVENGTLELHAPDTVLADAVYVLSSPRLYRLARPRIQEVLSPLLRLPGFLIDNRQILLTALDIYASTTLDFGDAMIVASMRGRHATVLYSYDHDFNRISGIDRREP